MQIWYVKATEVTFPEPGSVKGITQWGFIDRVIYGGEMAQSEWQADRWRSPKRFSITGAPEEILLHFTASEIIWRKLEGAKCICFIEDSQEVRVGYPDEVVFEIS